MKESISKVKRQTSEWEKIIIKLKNIQAAPEAQFQKHK